MARAAGVSLATVDRVLNARPGVRAKTVERVQAAVAELGYTRDVSAANLARQRRYRFAFVLPEGASQFLKGLSDAVAEAAPRLLAERCEVRVLRMNLDDPLVAHRAALQLGDGRTDGVAIMANETPTARDLIARLKGRAVAVVSLVTDQPNAPRDRFVGIDNVAAGRTAGVLMGRFAGVRSGRIAMIVSTMLARDMVQRRFGFDQVMARDFPHLVPLPSAEGHDDRDRTAGVTAACLDRHPDIVGIYCLGAGTSGVTRVVSDRGLSDRLVVIAHELTPHTRKALTDGVLDVVITQNTGHLVRSATRVLRARCDGTDVIPSQERIRIDIVLKENLGSM
ncbi:MAG: LacI family DNA-binding transcriptional regulator [Rhodobacteraceae bacterium]|nr:LacI family DNA-binding transcriptional regulator [Paracoccaceae bacterium]